MTDRYLCTEDAQARFDACCAGRRAYLVRCEFSVRVASDSGGSPDPLREALLRAAPERMDCLLVEVLDQQAAGGYGFRVRMTADYETYADLTGVFEAGDTRTLPGVLRGQLLAAIPEPLRDTTLVSSPLNYGGFYQ